MNNKHFLNVPCQIDDKYIMGAAPGTKKKRLDWRKWAAAAACLCLLAGGVFGIMRMSTTREEAENPSFSETPDAQEFQATVQDRLLAAIRTDGYQAAIAFRTSLPIAGRIAVYEQLYYAGSTSVGDAPESPENTGKLAPFVGDQYMVYGESSWYRVRGMDELKYLISEDAAGTLRLWEFQNFYVIDGMLMELREAEATEQELAEAESAIRERFPDADLSPYTYGDVYETIFNVMSADSIKCITASPSNSNNTPLGKEIQEQIGTLTYWDHDVIAQFYDATVNVVCYGAGGWAGIYRERDKYTYSFSTNAADKLSSGEETWATRYLSVVLKSGTSIDRWKYTALNGRFYEFGGVGTEPLSEETVYLLNAIFGIE